MSSPQIQTNPNLFLSIKNIRNPMKDTNRIVHQISEAPSSMPSETIPPHFIIPPPQTPSESSFPILALSIIGILATAILLLSYCVFVTKCCLNWHRANIITHPRHHRRREDLFALYSAMSDAHGLAESAIQSIPTFRYRRCQAQGSFHECAVCLNDFQEEERIRILPNCFHVFHIDCLDTWLQTHENCPLCRSEITTTSPMLTNLFTEQNPNQNSDERERLVADEAQARTDDAELRFEQRNGRKLPHVSSMGDECIDVRDKGGEFAVQTLRRSFSMNSFNDRQLYTAVQEMLQKKIHYQTVSSGEESSSGSSGRFGRSFFSFSHSRSSKSAVLPIQNEV